MENTCQKCGKGFRPKQPGHVLCVPCWIEDTLNRNIDIALDKIRNAAKGEMHFTRTRQACLIGGYVADGAISEAAALAALESAVSASATNNHAKALKDVRDAFRHGLTRPVENRYTAPGDYSRTPTTPKLNSIDGGHSHWIICQGSDAETMEKACGYFLNIAYGPPGAEPDSDLDKKFRDSKAVFYLAAENDPPALEYANQLFNRYHNFYPFQFPDGHESIKAMRDGGIFLISYFRDLIRKAESVSDPEPEPTPEPAPAPAPTPEIKAGAFPWICKSEKCYHYGSQHDECFYGLYFRTAAQPHAMTDLESCPMVGKY